MAKAVPLRAARCDRPVGEGRCLRACRHGSGPQARLASRGLALGKTPVLLFNGQPIFRLAVIYAYRPLMSPTSQRRDDRYAAETVSSKAGHARQQQLRLVRHLASRADVRKPTLLAGRCCISLEGGNRGERHGSCLTRGLWRLGCDGAVLTLTATLGRSRANDCGCRFAWPVAAAARGRQPLRRLGHAGHDVAQPTPAWTSIGWPVMERRHVGGGARIEQPRTKTCSTTMA